jgi:hypothetical protein
MCSVPVNGGKWRVNVKNTVSVIRGYQVSAMAMACDAIVMGRKGACLALLRAVSLESVQVKPAAAPAVREQSAKPSTQLQD